MNMVLTAARCWGHPPLQGSSGCRWQCNNLPFGKGLEVSGSHTIYQDTEIESAEKTNVRLMILKHPDISYFIFCVKYKQDPHSCKWWELFINKDKKKTTYCVIFTLVVSKSFWTAGLGHLPGAMTWALAARTDSKAMEITWKASISTSQPSK